MFTSILYVQQQLQKEGWICHKIETIKQGVMTDTYKVKIGDGFIAVRCYPKGREWLANVEYEYLIEFQKKGIKAPIPIALSNQDSSVSYLIYKWIEGRTLREVCNNLSSEELTHICEEILLNYNLISCIPSSKYGRVIKDRQYEHPSWRHFLKYEIDASRKYFLKEHDYHHACICNGLYSFADLIPEPDCNLVWSDLSLDNIIINDDNQLAGFIDFEGLISGDPLLGFGYLKSQEPNEQITKKLIELHTQQLDKEIEKRIDFYSVFRYIRLAPYSKYDTPNGSARTSLDSFLPYVKTIEESFYTEITLYSNFLRFIYFMWKKLTVLLITAILCVLALYGTYINYEPTLSRSQVYVLINKPQTIQFNEDIPVWFIQTDTSICTNKIMYDSDKKALYSCLLCNDSTKESKEYKQMKESIDTLAYKSNSKCPNSNNLIILTLCIIFLGCCARTFYDYIGWECWKGGQDMNTWWSWYVFRPLIGVPLTSFMMIAFRTSMFSALFTAKDLNTYLIVSFLAGFAMMEFLTMLRRSSKALFGQK